MANDSPHEQPEVLPAVPAFTPLTLIVASLTVALFALAVLIYLSKRKSASRGNAIVLVGPPDSGKTAILSTLAYNQTLPTHTSLQVNSSVISLAPPQKTVRVIDVPGHPRVRDQFQEHLLDAKAIAFVIDSSTVSRNGAAVAEHLHHVLNALTSLPPSHTPPSLIIVAHKIDLLKTPSTATAGSPNTLAVNRVTTILERELEKRRVAQTGGVGIEGLGEEGEKTEMGGLECSGSAAGTFKFADWEGGEITFVGTSVKSEKSLEDSEKLAREDGLELLREWLNEVV